MEMTKPVDFFLFKEFYLKHSETKDIKNFEEVSELLAEFNKTKLQADSINVGDEIRIKAKYGESEQKSS